MDLYEVVTDTVTVPADSTGDPNTYTLTAPTGKLPTGGGVHQNLVHGQGFATVTSSYPDGADWKFEIIGGPNAVDVDLYLIAL